MRRADASAQAQRQANLSGGEWLVLRHTDGSHEAVCNSSSYTYRRLVACRDEGAIVVEHCQPQGWDTICGTSRDGSALRDHELRVTHRSVALCVSCGEPLCDDGEDDLERGICLSCQCD